MLRRLIALGVLLVLGAGVCPATVLVAAGPERGCCKHDDACGAIRAAMSCCTSRPGIPEAPASTASAAARCASADAPVSSATPDALPDVASVMVSVAADTHGHLPVPPLLRSCVARV